MEFCVIIPMLKIRFAEAVNDDGTGEPLPAELSAGRG